MKKKLISLLLAAASLASLAVPVSAAGALPFQDISETNWYYAYAKDLYEDGVINGVSSTSFDPAGEVTLGQALKLFLLIGGYEEQTPTTTHWASGYYRLANKLGYLGSARTLTLDQPVNRQQIAELAANILGLSRTSHTRSPFSDTMNLSVLALYDYGIVTGATNDKGKLCFYPRQKITRAEVSAIVWRIRELGLDTQNAIPVDDIENPAIVETEPEAIPEETPASPGTPDTPTYTGESFTFNKKTLYMAANVPRNPYNTALFQLAKNGYMSYTGNSYDYQVGIDVSRYQGAIDWAAVKQAGIEFAIIRVGYRGYGAAGTLVQDAYFLNNIKGAIAQNIPVGVYFFSQATSAAEAIEEANYVLERVKGYNLSLPIIFDWEPYPASKQPRTLNLSDKLLTQSAVAFCETIKDAGYTPMVYANLTYFYLHFDISQLAEYPLWLAQYNTKPTFRYSFDIWQYGCTGSVPGINGDVDMNIRMIPK